MKHKDWQEEFNKRFPWQEHERYTKCNCSSEEEHDLMASYMVDGLEVKEWIASQIEKTRREAYRDGQYWCISNHRMEVVNQRSYKDGFKAGLKRAIEILEDPNNVQYKQWLENLKKALND